MPTKLSVFNDALGLLGQPLLEDPEVESNEDAITLRGHWQSVVEIAHEKTAWDFAKVRWQCARLDQTPAHGYKYYYALPPDLLRLLYVSETGQADDETLAWEGEPGKIATDLETIYITYISDASTTAVGRWSASFAYYVATELAARSAGKINSSAVEHIIKERKKALSDAIGLDATQGPVKRARHGSWSRAARGGYLNSDREQG